MIFKRNLSRVTLLKLVTTLVIIVMMSVLTVVISDSIATRLYSRAEKDLEQQVNLVKSNIASYNMALLDSAEKMMGLFRLQFPGAFVLDDNQKIDINARQVVALKNGETVLNLNMTMVDKFHEATNSDATIFVRDGDEFVRIATSLKKDDGARAVGTVLIHTHPAYPLLMQGLPYRGKASLFGKDYMTEYLPIKDAQGKVIAVLFIGLDFTQGLQALKNKIRAQNVGKTGYFYVLDANAGNDFGKLQIHPDKEGKNVAGMQDAQGNAYIKDILQQKEGVLRYPWVAPASGNTASDDYLVAFTYFNEWGWIICAVASLDEMSSEVVPLRHGMFVGTALGAVLLILIFSIMMRCWITLPMRKVNRTSDVLSSAAQTMHITADTLIQGSQQVLDQVSHVAIASEELSSSSNEIAQSCQIAADSAAKATQSARYGSDVVQETVSGMARIAGNVQESARLVEHLGARNEQVGSIVDIIDKIAAKTQMLALNAAIEAARAGDYGRGFAVVAEEVRALASRTSLATNEIGEMVKSIQEETLCVVGAMNKGVAEVKVGTDNAARSGAALQEILEQINVVAKQVSQIASGADEQTITTREISNNMSQVTGFVQVTLSSAQESAQSAVMLNQNAEELQRIVRLF